MKRKIKYSYHSHSWNQKWNQKNRNSLTNQQKISLEEIIGFVVGSCSKKIVLGTLSAGAAFFSQSATQAQTLFPADFDLNLINGANGFRIRGITTNDFSGRSVSGAGDVNGDGLPDVIIGAPYAAPNSFNGSGQTYVVFGSSNIPPGANFELSSLNGANGFRLNGFTNYDNSGTAVSGAGDFNGDGFDDVIVGAPSAERDDSATLFNNAGNSYLVFGKNGGFGASLDFSSLDGTNGFRIIGITNNHGLGTSVKKAGDINGDGRYDVIIGARGASPNGLNQSGQSYLIFGTSSNFGAAGLDMNLLDDSGGTNGFSISGALNYDGSGSAVNSAGDFNGDGLDDLIIGAPYASRNAANIGQSYIIFGRSNGFGTNLNLSSLDGTNGFSITGINDYDFSGKSVSSVGDFNGDGLSDVIIGAPYADPNSFNGSGQTYVVFGTSNFIGTNLNLSSLNGANGFQINGRFLFDNSGYSVSGAGDINGDGMDDLVMGADNANPNGNVSGESYVIFGHTPPFGSILNLWDLNGNNGFRMWGVSPDLLGRSVSEAGDFNGDGIDDLILGAPFARPHGDYSGQSYLIFGRRATGGPGGIGEKTIGDFNGDGLDDVLLQKKTELSILARPNASSSNFTSSALSPALSKGQKVIAANDLTGDGQPEILLRKGKTVSVMTVSTNLTISSSSFGLPTLAKGFKIVATGRLGTNAAVVASKGKRVTIHSGSLTASRTNEAGFKVLGLGFNGSVNPSVLFLRKGKTLKQVSVNVISNSIVFGAVGGSGTIPKGSKAVGLARILNTNQVDVIVQKKTAINVLTSPAYMTVAPVGTVNKGQKGVGPK